MSRRDENESKQETTTTYYFASERDSLLVPYYENYDSNASLLFLRLFPWLVFMMEHGTHCI